MSDQTARLQGPRPVTRARIAYDVLAKEGYRYDCTVEVEWDDQTSDETAIARLEALDEQLQRIGAAGVVARNAAREGTP